MTCGVYKISFSNTDKVYIGSSNDIDKRIKQHKAMLESDCHHSYKLQNYYNNNKEYILFSTLQECSEVDKFKVEAYWIGKYNAVQNGFNVAEVLAEDCVRYNGADANFIGIPEILEINFRDMLYNKTSMSEEIVYAYMKYAIEHCNTNNLDFCLSQDDMATVLQLILATIKMHIRNLISKNKIAIGKGISHNRNTYSLPD